MRNYDIEVSYAKRHATITLCRWVSEIGGDAATDIAGALESLNAAWDRLTDALVRQRQERDTLIKSLIDQIAELRRE